MPDNIDTTVVLTPDVKLDDNTVRLFTYEDINVAEVKDLIDSLTKKKEGKENEKALLIASIEQNTKTINEKKDTFDTDIADIDSQIVEQQDKLTRAANAGIIV